MAEGYRRSWRAWRASIPAKDWLQQPNPTPDQMLTLLPPPQNRPVMNRMGFRNGPLGVKPPSDVSRYRDRASVRGRHAGRHIMPSDRNRRANLKHGVLPYRRPPPILRLHRICVPVAGPREAE